MATVDAMAELIKEAIDRDGLSQAEFARRVGASTKHVNQVFRGHAAAHPDTLDDWAGAIGRQFVVNLSREVETAPDLGQACVAVIEDFQANGFLSKATLDQVREAVEKAWLDLP